MFYKYYLIYVWGDVSPTIKGPYKDETARLRAARRYRRLDSGDMKDGIYALDVPFANATLAQASGKPIAWAFSGGALQ